jgi:hypothetical protein
VRDSMLGNLEHFIVDTIAACRASYAHASPCTTRLSAVPQLHTLDFSERLQRSAPISNSAIMCCRWMLMKACGGKKTTRKRMRLIRWSCLWVASAAVCACLENRLAEGCCSMDKQATVVDQLCNRCSSAVTGVLQQHRPNRRPG